MGSPFPANPRAKRRARPRHATMVLACPRLSPDWEFNALAALAKPSERTKRKIEHLPTGRQLLPTDGEQLVRETVRAVADRLGFAPEIFRAEAGDFLFAIPFNAANVEEAKGLAIAISRRLPALWLTLGRLTIHDGTFRRRQYGYKLKLVPATNVHLRREIRSALKGLV